MGASADTQRWNGSRGCPRQNRLGVSREDPSDRSIKLGLTPYHAIAPKLNHLQKVSDRVSAEVIGKSARSLVLPTSTADLLTPRANDSDGETGRIFDIRSALICVAGVDFGRDSVDLGLMHHRERSREI